jgi:hypothetical protein
VASSASKHHARRVVCIAIADIVLLAVCSSTRAATPLTRQEQAVVNFGFATQLGSGVYTMSGRTLQVYSLPIGYTLPGDDASRWSLRLTMPITLGLIDFEPIDVVESGLPENFDSISIVPGVEIGFAVNDAWLLQSFVEGGVARDRTNELDQRVYAAGVRSRFDLGSSATLWQLEQELLHVVVEQQGGSGRDDCTRLRFGATARRAFEASLAGRRPDYLLYAVADLYTDTPSGPAEGEHPGSGTQLEVGITFGTVEPMRLGRVPLPRVGIGYRFGEDLSVFRLVLGSAF